MNGCTFSGNYVLGGGRRWRDSQLCGPLTITDSTFVGNQANSVVTFGGAAEGAGSAIYSFNSVSITNSTFVNNYAAFSGTVEATAAAVITVTNTTFLGNTTGFGPNFATAVYNDTSPAIDALVVTNSVMDVATNSGASACVSTSSSIAHRRRQWQPGRTCLQPQALNAG